MTKHKSYSHELKVEAVKAVVEGRMTKSEAMEIYGIDQCLLWNLSAGFIAKEDQMTFALSLKAEKRKLNFHSPLVKRSLKRGFASWNWRTKS